MKDNIKKLFNEAYEFVKKETGSNIIHIIYYPFNEYMLYYTPLDPFTDIGYGNLHVDLMILKEAGILDRMVDAMKQSGLRPREKYVSKIEHLSALYFIIFSKFIEQHSGNLEGTLKKLMGGLMLNEQQGELPFIVTELILKLASPQTAAAMLIYENTKEDFKRLLKSFINFMVYLYDHPEKLDIKQNRKDVQILVEELKKLLDYRTQEITEEEMTPEEEIFNYTYVYAWKDRVLQLLDVPTRLAVSVTGQRLGNQILDDTSKFVFASYNTKAYWKGLLDEAFSDETNDVKGTIFKSPVTVREKLEKEDYLRLILLGIYSLYFDKDAEFRYDSQSINPKKRYDEYMKQVEELYKKIIKSAETNSFAVTQEYRTVLDSIIKQYEGDILFDMTAPDSLFAYTRADEQNKKYYIVFTPKLAGGITPKTILAFYWNHLYPLDPGKETKISSFQVSIPYTYPNYVRDAAYELSMWSRHLYAIWSFMEYAWEKVSEYLASKVADDVVNAWSEIIAKENIYAEELIDFYKTYSQTVLSDEDVQRFMSFLNYYYEEKLNGIKEEVKKVADFFQKYIEYLEGKSNQPPQRLPYSEFFKIIQIFLHEAFHIIEGDVFKSVGGRIIEVRNQLGEILNKIYNKLLFLILTGKQLTTKDEWKIEFSNEFEELARFLKEQGNFIKYDMAMEIAKETLSGLLIAAIYKFDRYAPPVSIAYMRYLKPSVDAYIDEKSIQEREGGEEFYDLIKETMNHLRSVTGDMLERLGFDVVTGRDLIKRYINFRVSRAIKQSIIAVMYNPYARITEYAPEINYFGANGVIFQDDNLFVIPWVTEQDEDKVEIPYSNLALRLMVYNATVGNNLVLLKDGTVYIAHIVDMLEKAISEAGDAGSLSQEEIENWRNIIARVASLFQQGLLDVTKNHALYGFLLDPNYRDINVPITCFVLKSEVPLEDYIEVIFKNLSLPKEFIDAFSEYAEGQGVKIKEGKINWTDVSRINPRTGELIARFIIKYAKGGG